MSLKVRAVFNSSQLPQSIEIGVQQVEGITVDNYSIFWLQIGNDIFIPPKVLGWAGNLLGSAAGGMIIKKGVPAGISNPSLGVTDDVIVVAIYDTFVQPAPGIAVLGVAGWDFNSEDAVAAGTRTYITQSPTMKKGQLLRSLSVTAFITGGLRGSIMISLFDGAVSNPVWIASLPVGALLVVTPQVLITPLVNSAGLVWNVRVITTDLAGVNAWTYNYNIGWW